MEKLTNPLAHLNVPKWSPRSIHAFLFSPLMAACFGLTSIGTHTLVDGKSMSKVEQIGDATLTADARKLEGKSFRAGNGDYYAGLCLQGYINGRYADLVLANTQDETQKQTLEGERIGGYGTCASHCMNATKLGTSYGEIASRYEPLCNQGVASQKASWTTQGLAKAVKSFSEASEPLALFFGNRDSRSLLAQAKTEIPDEPSLVDYENEIEALSKEHAASIAKGRRFFEGRAAQTNFQKREVINAERSALQEELAALERNQEDLRANGSLDSHMRSRELDDQIGAKRRLLEAKTNELSRLKEAYRRLALKAGVVNEG